MMEGLFRLIRVERGEGAPTRLIMIDGDGTNANILIAPKKKSEFADAIEGKSYFRLILEPEAAPGKAQQDSERGNP